MVEYLPSPDWKPPSDEGNIFTDEIMNKVASIKAEDTGNYKFLFKLLFFIYISFHHNY